MAGLNHLGAAAMAGLNATSAAIWPTCVGRISLAVAR